MFTLNTIIELRPGNGGKDAEDFTVELADSLTTALGRAKYQHQVQPMSDAARGFIVKTNAPVDRLTWLAGSHVVTRIPKGAAARHTSSATVVVRDEKAAPLKEVQIQDSDVRIDRYRGHGAGGQRKNKVSTAIRVTHLPSGIVITRETGRSQSANLDDAMRDLKKRLGARAQEQRGEKIAQSRTVLQEGNRAFTHNHQRNEVVCHATGKRWRMKDWSSGRWNPVQGA